MHRKHFLVVGHSQMRKDHQSSTLTNRKEPRKNYHEISVLHEGGDVCDGWGGGVRAQVEDEPAGFPCAEEQGHVHLALQLHPLLGRDREVQVTLLVVEAECRRSKTWSAMKQVHATGFVQHSFYFWHLTRTSCTAFSGEFFGRKLSKRLSSCEEFPWAQHPWS